MQYEATVLEKVTEAIIANKMFTSVDIANAVKREGLWVRNHEVRNWLQDNFMNKSLFQDYAISQISVCNNSSFASLYHPALNDPNDYLDRDQRPLTPDDVKAIQKANAGKVKSAADINKILATSDGDEDEEDDSTIEMSVVLNSFERLKIPGCMIRTLGWKPGQIVDPALILTTSTIPGKLKVNDDYRVSIPRNAVPWGISPVKVMLKQGKIHFEKA
jgi:hypothetical protein